MMLIDKECVFEGQTCVFSPLYLMIVFVQSHAVIKGDRNGACSKLNLSPVSHTLLQNI